MGSWSGISRCGSAPVRGLSTITGEPVGGLTSIQRSSPYDSSVTTSKPSRVVQKSFARDWSSTGTTILLIPLIISLVPLPGI